MPERTIKTCGKLFSAQKKFEKNGVISFKERMFSSWRRLFTESVMHRVTVTQFRSISMPAGFRRHFVGKTLINVSYCDTA